MNRLFTGFFTSVFHFSGLFLEVQPCGCHAAVMHCHEVVMHYQAAAMHYHAAVMHHHAGMCSKSVQASLIKTALREQTKTVQWREKMRITLYRTAVVEKTCSCIYPSVSRNVKGTIKRGKKFFLQLKSI